MPVLALAFCCVFSPALCAASLQADLVDAAGRPLANAVLTLRGPLGAGLEPAAAVMDQQAKQFVPNVLAVRTGTAVSFPNSDDIRHHVYSFSPAKRFELRLSLPVPAAANTAPAGAPVSAFGDAFRKAVRDAAQ
ncbi:hypothetical protein HP532_00440 [Pseudomonas sp. CrR25]|nr:hypothetical protein [Pseudomonas sp. CrR25]